MVDEERKETDHPEYPLNLADRSLWGRLKREPGFERVQLGCYMILTVLIIVHIILLLTLGKGFFGLLLDFLFRRN